MDACGGAEFAGPANDGPKTIKDWKMQDLENDRPNRSSGSGKRLLLSILVKILSLVHSAANLQAQNAFFGNDLAKRCPI